MNTVKRFLKGFFWGSVVGAIIGLLVVGIIALDRWSTRTYNVEVLHNDHTYTIIGHCHKRGLAQCDGQTGKSGTQNAVARRAGTLCGSIGQDTAAIYKLGDQRVVVVCR